MNPLISIIAFVFYIFLFFIGAGLVAFIYNVSLSIISKIFNTNVDSKHVYASVYSEDRINEDLIGHEAIERGRNIGPF